MGMARQTSVLKLTEGERRDLRALFKNGVLPVRTVVRALTLLRLDEGISAPKVAAMFELTGEGVRRIAHRYRDGGLESAVYEGARPGKEPVLDDSQRQKVVALACSHPPHGAGALDHSLIGGGGPEEEDCAGYRAGSHSHCSARPRPQAVAGKKCGACRKLTLLMRNAWTMFWPSTNDLMTRTNR